MPAFANLSLGPTFLLALHKKPCYMHPTGYGAWKFDTAVLNVFRASIYSVENDVVSKTLSCVTDVANDSQPN